MNRTIHSRRPRWKQKKHEIAQSIISSPSSSRLIHAASRSVYSYDSMNKPTAIKPYVQKHQANDTGGARCGASHTSDVSTHVANIGTTICIVYHETCGTEHQQPYRRCNSQTPYYKKNIAQAPNEHVLRPRSLQSWVSTTHRSYSQLTLFNILRIVYIFRTHVCCTEQTPHTAHDKHRTAHGPAPLLAQRPAENY